MGLINLVYPTSRLLKREVSNASHWVHQGPEPASADKKENPMNSTILMILAVILAVVGVVQLIQGQIIFGIVLLIAAALVGPGGHSIFRKT